MCDDSIKVILNDLKDNYSYDMTYEKTHDDYQIAYLLIMYSNINKIVFGTFNLYPFVKFVRHPETECTNNLIGTKEQIAHDALTAVKKHKLIYDQNWGLYVFEKGKDTAFVELTCGEEILKEQEKQKAARKATSKPKKNEDIQCYIVNNPWKLSIHNREQKFYRYCVLCGAERFTDEQWSKEIYRDGPPSICDDHPFEDDPIGTLWTTLDDSTFMHPYCSDKEYVRLRKEESFTEIKKK